MACFNTHLINQIEPLIQNRYRLDCLLISFFGAIYSVCLAIQFFAQLTVISVVSEIFYRIAIGKKIERIREDKMFLKYRSRNLSLIPLKLGQKRPLLSGWEQFSDRLPTELEARQWDCGNYGFGLVLGPASNLTALDIDSDDPTILNACKQSPVRKRGKKGETRFFKFCSEIHSMKIAGCIDVLAKGRQTVLPPSIHPDTGSPYYWLTNETLENYNVLNLPEFRIHDLVSIQNILEPRSKIKDGSGSISVNNMDWRSAISRPIFEGTRNTTVTSIIGGLLRSGIHPRDIFEYILYINATKIHPPLEASVLESIMTSIMKREHRRRTARQV